MVAVSSPPGVPSALTLRATARALNFHESELRAACKSGEVTAFQMVKGGRWWIPAPEVERLARLMLTTPDWDAAIDTDL